MSPSHANKFPEWAQPFHLTLLVTATPLHDQCTVCSIEKLKELMMDAE